MGSVMESVQCAVNCTFKRSFSHEPAIKLNQTKPSPNYKYLVQVHLYREPVVYAGERGLSRVGSVQRVVVEVEDDAVAKGRARVGVPQAEWSKSDFDTVHVQTSKERCYILDASYSSLRQSVPL